MGLTHRSTGIRAVQDTFSPDRKSPDDRIIALAGNPNVGKSTLFNSLTGLRQHTGNWPGKTISNAQGSFSTAKRRYVLVDLPGAYSLRDGSPEEEIARTFLCSGVPGRWRRRRRSRRPERSLNLALQILAMTDRVILCVNLMDEAKKKGVRIDISRLSSMLGVPVVPTVAQKKSSLARLAQELDRLTDTALSEPEPTLSSVSESSSLILEAERIANACVSCKRCGYSRMDRKLDQLLTGPLTAYPAMFCLLALVFWITISGANYPSNLLSRLFAELQPCLERGLVHLSAPPWFYSLCIQGIYRVLTWVVAVMLPPMAIFFPLFTLLEDSGYLPRIAYNLDRPFCCCKTCGKQALTMAMGFGCNAAGIIGCRIIDSPRERLIAMLTNSLVPCNGRLPLLTTMISLFFVGAANGAAASVAGALLLTLFILLSIGLTLLASAVLSGTLLKGVPSSFILELPPYRKPQITQVLLRSVLDRTLFVLGRAAAAAIPAGLLLWLMANLHLGDLSLLGHLSRFLDPFGRLLGMDGTILTAFLLGFPANEIVIPIILMAYTAQGTLTAPGSLPELYQLLLANGWTWVTALCTMLFSLMHWPCSTTLLTLKKETGSWKWTFAALAIPTCMGILSCFLVSLIGNSL